MIYFALNAGGYYPWTYGALSIYDVLIMLGVIVFFLIINKVFNKQPLKFSVDENLELEQYTFGFEDTHVNMKKRSLPIRVLVCVISTLLIITPLSELLGQMSYNYTYFWIFS